MKVYTPGPIARLKMKIKERTKAPWLNLGSLKPAAITLEAVR